MMQMDIKAPPFRQPPRSTHFSSPSFTPHVTLGHVAGEEREVLSLLEKLARETSTFPVDARSKGQLMLMAVICKTWDRFGYHSFLRHFKTLQNATVDLSQKTPDIRLEYLGSFNFSRNSGAFGRKTLVQWLRCG